MKPDGELKLSTGADIGSGGADVEKIENQLTAESSESSAPSGKEPTEKTSKLTPEILLEIFQEGIIRLQKSGLDVRVKQIFQDGHSWVMVYIYDVEIVEKRLMLTVPKKQ